MKQKNYRYTLDDFIDDSPVCIFVWGALWPIREFWIAHKYLNVAGKIILMPIIVLFSIALSIPMVAFAIAFAPFEIFIYIMLGIGMIGKFLFVKH